MPALQHFVQSSYAHTAEWARVFSIAQELERYLSSAPIEQLITEVNVPGASSAKIAAIIGKKASELGFRNDLRNLFEGTPNQGLRPDFYLPFEKEKTGISPVAGLLLRECYRTGPTPLTSTLCASGL